MAKNAEVEASYSGRIRATKIFRTIICVILCIISVFPFYLMIVNSTLDSNTIKTGVHLLPGSFAQFGKNFSGLMAKAQGVGTSLWGAMLHSAIISVPATILTVYNFKLKNAAHTFIMAIMMIPAQVSIIGFMQFMMKVHLYDSYWPLILPAAASPATYYFMKQYMATGLSLEIIEAARIDGSGEFSTFNKIALPLMKPAMATQAIFAFITSWNNLYTPSMMLTDTAKKTLPMFIMALRSEQFRQDYGVIYLGLFLTVLPIFIVYFTLSKYIIAGVALGGVKE